VNKDNEEHMIIHKAKRHLFDIYSLTRLPLIVLEPGFISFFSVSLSAPPRLSLTGLVPQDRSVESNTAHVATIIILYMYQ